MMEPWVSLGLRSLVVLIFGTLWAVEVGNYLHRRDARSLREAIAAGMVVLATIGLWLLALQRAGLVTIDIRTFLLYGVTGALLVGGALLLSARVREP